ncbi:hypothetical protein [Halorubrum laminariae]|uniref:Uncharacterized protein n=1 Tax=Halorubrum laminariae TaxID=1433523 RepID=A0ABD6BYK4_9EURY|nr:hypothetical protein [Halorubrum laminariae]
MPITPPDFLTIVATTAPPAIAAAILLTILGVLGWLEADASPSTPHVRSWR